MNIRNDCIEILSGILVQDGELEAVVNGGPLFSTASFDSLTLVNLIVALENKFSMQIDSDDFESIFGSLGSLVSYVESRTGR